MRSLISICALLLCSLTASAATLTGTFPVTLTGCSVSPAPATASGTASYIKDSDSGSTFLVLPKLYCNSGSAVANIDGLPTNLVPVSTIRVPVNVTSFGVQVPGQFNFFNGNASIALSAWNGTAITTAGFNTGGTKGLFQEGTVAVYFSTPEP